jgi:tetratricopeptide (TPR) repeat protein
MKLHLLLLMFVVFASVLVGQTDAKVYYNRGVELQNVRDWDGAIFFFTKAIQLDPKFTFAYYNRGRALGYKGDLEGLISVYTRLLTLTPNM